MSLISDLAYKAGIIKSEDFTVGMERIGGRGYIANEEELTKFAKLVGQLAREDERRKYAERDDPSLSADEQGT